MSADHQSETAFGVVGYLRLSRDEEKERGVSMEDKISIRKQILVAIAKHHAIILPEAAIVVELKSGGNLSEREGLLTILEKCRRREVHTVIAFDVDRLTRDVADLKTITSAFYKGEVTLITQRGVDRFDRNHDSTLLQILAVLGEKERRSFSYRRKATNLQRAREGKLSQGLPPYGYRWNSEAKRYEVEPLQYSILEEICTLIRTTGSHTIAHLLNTRGVPPPSHGKRNQGAKTWLPGTILNMLCNPFYAGHPAKRTEVDRDGITQQLPRSQWTWAEGEQEYPHPLTMDEWEQIQDIIGERKSGELRQGLLTGLLRCSQGKKMHMRLENYTCECDEVHRGRFISRAMIEPAVIKALVERIDGLPAGKLARPGRKSMDRDALASERSQVRRDLREKQATMQELVARASFYHSLPGYGPARHQETLTTLGKEVEQLESRLAAIEAKLSVPDYREISTAIAGLHGSVEAIFQAMERPKQRALLARIIKRIDLCPIEAGRGVTRSVVITLHPLLEGEVEHTLTSPLLHPSTGKKRGPYLWRRKQI